MPPDNARHLARSIPNAEVKLWPEAAHLYITDEPEADLHVLRFLKAHTGARRRDARSAAPAPRAA